MRAASKTAAAFGLVGLLAALAFLGGAAPAGRVMAALSATTGQASVSTTGAYWAIVVNGTTGAKTFSIPVSAPTQTCTSFTLDNIGNRNALSATQTAEVAVTVFTNNWRIWVYPNGTCTNAGTRLSITGNSGGTGTARQLIPETAAWARPSTTSPTVTWSFNRRDPTACNFVAPAVCRLTISVTFSSADLAAATTANG